MPQHDEYAPNVGETLQDDANDVLALAIEIVKIEQETRRLIAKNGIAPGAAECYRHTGQKLSRELKQLYERAASEEKQLSAFTFQEVA